MKMDAVNILLTSAGRRTYLVKYFKEALNGMGLVHAANSSELSPSFTAADRTVITPLIYANGYIDFLLDYCKKNNITAIVSLFDIDLPVLAANRHQFEAIGTKLIVSDEDIIGICNDKWKSFQFLKQNGFVTPATYLSPEEALEAVSNGSVTFPFIIKPRWGMGSMSIYEAENETELRLFYEKAIKQIMNSYLKYESSQDVDEAILIQEKRGGQEYGLDVINDLNGVYQNTIVKLKYAMRSGETDCAITVDHKGIKAIGKQLSGLLGHIGNLDVDVFVDGDTICILEMNARFGGGYPFSHMAGVNLPLAIVKWLQGAEDCRELLTEKYNVRSHKDIELIRL